MQLLTAHQLFLLILLLRFLFFFFLDLNLLFALLYRFPKFSNLFLATKSKTKEQMVYNVAIVFVLWFLVILWCTKGILPFSNPDLIATSFQQLPVTSLWWYSGVCLSYRQGSLRIQSLKTPSCSETLILVKEKNSCALQKIFLFLFSNIKLNVKNIRLFKWI